MAFENYGPGVYGPYYNAGAPVAGTNEVQSLATGGTITGGTFTLSHDGVTTAAIAYSGVAATLVAAINAALDAKFGAGQIVASGAGSPFSLTFSGSNYARRDVSLMTANTGSLTGTAPTMTIATTTPGVTQTGRDYAKGATLIDVTNGKTYQSTGPAGAPVWGVVGSQS